MSGGNDITGISLTFGFAITALVYATAHNSGGHINCAVTLAFVLLRKISLPRAGLYLIAQFLGALVGAGLLVAVYPDAAELGLGANYRAASVSISQAIIGETIATFLLVFVVLETALNERSVAKNNAPIAIGLAVFLAHTTLIPLTGMCF